MAKKNDASSDVKLIIEKYMAQRDDIAEPMKRVFITLYRGKTNTVSEWDSIIKSRLERPA